MAWRNNGWNGSDPHDVFENLNDTGIWAANNLHTVSTVPSSQVAALDIAMQADLAKDEIYLAESDLLKDSKRIVPSMLGDGNGDGVVDYDYDYINKDDNGNTMIKLGAPRNWGRTHLATDVTTPNLVRDVDPDTGLDQDDIVFGATEDDFYASLTRQIGVMVYRSDDNPTPDSVHPFTTRLRPITYDLFERSNGDHFERAYCWQFAANCDSAQNPSEMPPIDKQSIRLYLEKVTVNVFTKELFGIGSDTYHTHPSAYEGIPDNPNSLPDDQYGMGFEYDDTTVFPATGRGKYKQMANIDSRLPGFSACVGNGGGLSAYKGADIKFVKKRFLKRR